MQWTEDAVDQAAEVEPTGPRADVLNWVYRMPWAGVKYYAFQEPASLAEETESRPADAPLSTVR